MRAWGETARETVRAVLTGQASLRRQTALLIAAGLLSLLLLTGCVTMTDLEASQEQAKMQVGIADGEATVEQTFVSRRGRLNGLTLWLSSGNNQGDPETSTAEITLFSEPGDTEPLFQQIHSITGSSELNLQLPAQPNLAGQTYRVRIRSLSGPVQVLGMDLDLYTNGEAFVGGQSLESDIAFRLTYDYSWGSALEDAVHLIRLGWLALPLAGMLILPGWLVLDLSGIRRRFDRWQQWGLATGLSLGIIPVAMLWSTVLGLEWSTWGVRAAVGLIAAACAWRLWRGRSRKRTPYRPDWITIGLAAVFMGSLFLRFAMLRDLSAPAWVDSVHHALITRLIVQNGGFPATYAPYFDLAATEYHAGFHSGLAVFQWLSGASLPQSLLVYGQVLNALVCPSVYLLASTLTGSRKAGLAAAVISAFFTPMPAYYASWGRYTQLAGLLVLPAAFALLAKGLNLPRQGLTVLRVGRTIILLAVCAGGLVLVHYRAAIFFALLAGAYLVARVSMRGDGLRLWLGRALTMGVVPSLAAVLLVIPWVLPNLKEVLLPGLAAGGSGGVSWFSDHSWAFITPGLGTMAVWLALGGLGLAFVRCRRLAVTITLWLVGMVLMANFGALGLPLGSLISTSSVEIMLFMPISVLGGYLAAEGWRYGFQSFSGRRRSLMQAAVLAGGSAISFFGALQLLPIINPVTLLVREPDLRAIGWIDDNLPEDETVLINTFNWGYGVYAGRDGGYWISPLTGRATLPPPVLFGFGEPATIQATLDASAQIEQLGGDIAALSQHMDSLGISYLYAGVRGGPLWVPGLLASDQFELLYEVDGVYIFQRKD